MTPEHNLTSSATISEQLSHYYAILKLSRKPGKVHAGILLAIPARYSYETCTSNDHCLPFTNGAICRNIYA